ncbi:hypothetical protein Taro_021113, partial [Colocasia esculenta]|nr:hypothetical protein [Colocasia esculenta]
LQKRIKSSSSASSSCADQLKALAAAAMAEEPRVDVAGLNPPPAQGPVDGGDADDWSRELDDAPAPSPAATAEENLAPPPPPSDDVSELRSDLQALHLEPNASTRDSEMDVQKEEEELVETGKRHLNVVFIGHVGKDAQIGLDWGLVGLGWVDGLDAGKSTIGGQILLLSGQVDERTIQKYEKEAKDKSRESWYMAYIMDTNEEERVKHWVPFIGVEQRGGNTTRRCNYRGARPMKAPGGVHHREAHLVVYTTSGLPPGEAPYRLGWWCAPPARTGPAPSTRARAACARALSTCAVRGACSPCARPGFFFPPVVYTTGQWGPLGFSLLWWPVAYTTG